MCQHVPDALRVELGTASSYEELDSLLAAAFHFPDHYGHNWDAFDACIRDVELPARVETTGFDALRTRLPREAELLRRCIGDFVSELHHDITIRMAWPCAAISMDSMLRACRWAANLAGAPWLQSWLLVRRGGIGALGGYRNVCVDHTFLCKKARTNGRDRRGHMSFRRRWRSCSTSRE